MSYLHTADIEIEGLTVPAEFDVDTYPAEPFSWGGSRGKETVVELAHIKLGSLKLDRFQLIDWIGKSAVETLEEAVNLQ